MLELTRVERNVLLILYSENRPLGERSDLERTFGISMAKRHREKLLGLGLIHSSQQPFAHSITKAGRDWVAAQMRAQTTKVGWHKSALFVMWKYASSKGIPLGEFFRETDRDDKARKYTNGQTKEPGLEKLPSGRTQAEMLQDADMKEVDEALALMLQDQPVIDKALSRLSQKASPTLQNELEGAKRAIKLVLQWGHRAAHKRSIVLMGNQGEEVAFDPLLYQSDEPTKAGARVQVRRAAVVRKTITGDLILARGQTAPAN